MIELREVLAVCSLEIVSQTIVFGLIILEMTDFDVIIGMDWLTTFRAKIDCSYRRVTFRTPEGETLKFIGNQRWSPILPLMESIFTNIWSEGGDTIVTEYPFIVREYANVFPNTLREVEFTIELLPRTAPIYFPAYYKMAHAEMIELMKQLKELLDLEFIRPNSLPWGSPVLFARKNDGSLHLCVKYKKLKAVTIENKHTMSWIDDLFDKLRGSRCFSKIDLRIGLPSSTCAREGRPEYSLQDSL